MTTASTADRPFPLFPLVGAGSLILISLLSVAWVRWFAEPDMANVPQTSVLQARSLYFEDQPGGEVAVLDASSSEQIAMLAVGEHGFIRSTLRGLARARKARGLGSETPFVLERMSNGQLILVDPVTDQRIDLWAFGEINARSFEEFLDDGSLAGTTPPAADTGKQTVHNAAMASSIEVEYSE